MIKTYEVTRFRSPISRYVMRICTLGLIKLDLIEGLTRSSNRDHGCDLLIRKY